MKNQSKNDAASYRRRTEDASATLPEELRARMDPATMTEAECRRFLAGALLEQGYDPKAPPSLSIEHGSAAINVTDILWGDSAASVA